MTEFITIPLLITEYYDSLISQLDIYTEEKIKEYKEKGLPEKRINDICGCGGFVYVDKNYNYYGVETMKNPYEKQTYNIDRNDRPIIEINDISQAEEYMNKVRQTAIDKIRKIKEENLNLYNENQHKFKVDRTNLTDEKKLEELKCQLFGNKFCFLVKKQPIEIREYWEKASKLPIFSLHTIITDFYLREFDIDYIRKDIDGKYEIIKPTSTEFGKRFLLANQAQKYIEKTIVGDLNGYEIIEIKQKTLLEIEHIRVLPYNCRKFVFKETDLSFDTDIDLSFIKSLILYADAKITDLSGFVNLEYLYISRFKLCQSPFQNLKKLIKIQIYNCDLSEFDFDSLNSITSLQIIDIDLDTCRSIKYLQSVSFKIDLNMLINLKWIDLKFINEHEVNNLELITGSYNQLTFVRVNKTAIDFSKQIDLPELKYLKISNIDDLSQQISQKCFYSMSNLIELYVNNSNLRNVDFLDTDRLRNLEKLDLSDNQITVLIKGVFSKLKKLKRLNLDKNKIRELFPGDFEGLECLEKLNLESNNINIGSIDKRVFDELKYLKDLYIRDYEDRNVNVDHLMRDGLNVY